jgi:hypothetical protein
MASRARNAFHGSGIYMVYSWWSRHKEGLRSYRRGVYVVPGVLFVVALLLPLGVPVWVTVVLVAALGVTGNYAVYVWWRDRRGRKAARVTSKITL